MDRSSISLLETGLSLLQFTDPSLLDHIRTFLEELERWNPRFGLVGTGGKDLVVRHVLDCLAGAPLFRELSPSFVADVGAGAGFPGIPLALCLPEIRFTLIEPSRKRAAFLRNIRSLLRIENIQVWEQDLEYLSRNLLPEERFPCLTFRAFSPLNEKRLKQLLRILKKGGSIIAYKGRRELIEKEAALGESLGLTYRIVEVTVPFLEETRHLLCFNSSS